ncbi:MAG: VanZ family protein [Lachnospiraceae bacterium]|jgi:VanZ family protein|nr:VanZ family protein [Lachnospiraceae bacterium]
MKKLFTGLLALAWMGIIFAFSAQSAVESSQTSQSVSYQIAEWQNRLFGLEKTEEELLEQAEGMQLVIRKGAHMSEYALLAILLGLHLGCYSFSDKKVLLWAFAAAVCYAATDEFHQLFVPGRAGRITDVCIDGAGCLAGVIFYYAVWGRKRGRENF